MDRPIKILFLAANPRDTSQLRLDEEMRGIDQALRQAEFRDRFEIKQHWAVRVIDLQGYLLRHQPDIVHFSGHGSTSSEIILEDNNGNSQPVSSRALRGHLKSGNMVYKITLDFFMFVSSLNKHEKKTIPH